LLSRWLSVYTYEVGLVNSRCLHETILKVETIDGVYLAGLPSELTLFLRDNSSG
jgi:hypothetical protein